MDFSCAVAGVSARLETINANSRRRRRIMAVLQSAGASRRRLSVRDRNAREPPFRACPARAQRAFARAYPNNPPRRVKAESSDALMLSGAPASAFTAGAG